MKFSVFPDTVTGFFPLLANFQGEVGFNFLKKVLIYIYKASNHPDLCPHGVHENWEPSYKMHPWVNLWPWEKTKGNKGTAPSVIGIWSVQWFMFWTFAMRFHGVFHLWLVPQIENMWSFLLTSWLHLHHEVFYVTESRYGKEGWACHPLLPGLFHLCGGLRSCCGFDKVLGDNLILAQPPDTVLNHSEDLL